MMVRLNDESLSMLLIKQDADMPLDICNYGCVINEEIARSMG